MTYHRASHRLDEYAELLAEDVPADAIRERMGLRPEQARTMLWKIRKRLGEQAK